MNPSKETNIESKNRFKSFSPEKKLDLAMQLYFSARELKRAALKEFYPEWDKKKIDAKLKEIFLYART